MNKKIALLSFIGLGFFSFLGTAHASLSIDAQVDVPTICSMTDTDGLVHNYPQGGFQGTYYAICAIDAAEKNGTISNVLLSNQFPSLGLFITSINNVAADPNSQYWAIYQNGSSASLGATLLPITTGDAILFQRNDFSDNNLGDQVTLHIHSLIPPPAPSGSGPLLASIYIPINDSARVVTVVKPVFNINKALQFLSGQQHGNGSFGEDLYTDWSAMALSSGNNQDQVLKLIKYFEETKMKDPSLTDYERHAMALMSLGLNPYNTNGENYIKRITDAFDGKQFGDINQDNDDIFALIVLQNAGYTKNDSMINSAIFFVLGKQNNDGSWDKSVDMTGAAIEALSVFNKDINVARALIKAENFLRVNQKNDGSWNNNVSSTAWALEGILALGEKTENWVKGGQNPLDYFLSMQDEDGGIKNNNLQNKIWETDYTLAVLSGKPWNQLMQNFDKSNDTTTAPMIAKPLPITATIPAENLKINYLKNKTDKTVTAVTNITTPPTETKPTPKQRGWFTNILGYIFGF